MIEKSIHLEMNILRLSVKEKEFPLWILLKEKYVDVLLIKRILKSAGNYNSNLYIFLFFIVVCTKIFAVHIC